MMHAKLTMGTSFDRRIGMGSPSFSCGAAEIASVIYVSRPTGRGTGSIDARNGPREVQRQGVQGTVQQTRPHLLGLTAARVIRCSRTSAARDCLLIRGLYLHSPASEGMSMEALRSIPGTVCACCGRSARHSPRPQ